MENCKEKKLFEALKAADERLDKWVDEYFAGKIDNDKFSTLVILGQIDKLIFHYDKLSPHIGLIIGMLCDSDYSPKTKQQVDETLNKIKKIFNDNKSSDDVKEEQIAECEELLTEITGYLKKS